MPLPPALQARLMKRGILNKESEKKEEDVETKQEEEIEEVIAENYDESESSEDESEEEDGDDVEEEEDEDDDENDEEDELEEEESSEYDKDFNPDPVIEKRRLRMLKMYPLPPNWIEVPDYKTNRYYYWNTETDQVSWMSPSYPRARIESKKGSFQVEEPQKTVQVMPITAELKNESLGKIVESFDEHLNAYIKSVNEKNSTPAQQSKPKTSAQNYKRKSANSGAIDPMDPSSYSDIPRGKWSAGLDQ